MTTIPTTTLRERVREALETDPWGELSDLAVAAHLGCSEAAAGWHRRQLGVPSAQTRRRSAPGARVLRCDCGRVSLPPSGRRRARCPGCCALVEVTTNPSDSVRSPRVARLLALERS